jgi:hypothetical protein
MIRSFFFFEAVCAVAGFEKPRCGQRGGSRSMFWWAVVAMLVIAPAGPLTAMGSRQPAEQNKDSAPPAPLPAPVRSVTIKEIVENPYPFAGKPIVLEGSFRGWKGGCTSSSLLTRSDWVLEDSTGCIYVTGHIPGGLSPAQPKGERVQVKGRVIVDKNGKAIVQADQLTRLPDK